LPSKIKSTLKKTVKLTEMNKKIIVNLAINYGSRDEIVNACRKIKKKINIKSVEKNLYTKDSPNPDILVRTGGHKRLSNFMLWQLAYAEIYFLDKLWPDFNSNDLTKIINSFKKIKRNFGAI
jgi:undecaprenyl diphosphate synthase